MRIRSVLSWFFWKIYARLFHNLVIILRGELQGCESFLDLGCGRDSPVRYFSKEFKSTGVDAFEPYIEESRRKGIHDEYLVMDLRCLSFKPKSFDAVLALDVLEHMEKKEGERFLKDIERIAKKKVVVFTTNGFVKQEEVDGNRYQVHKTGWTVSEMSERGYKVMGVNGIKFLRKEKAELRYPPKYFWLIISDITEFFTYYFPEYAFQILCVKDVG
jgi:ubiquinone/menaquinone biosynthesis C-methylase UbiE